MYYDSRGKLQYRSDDAGNRIMDYSWAGYQGGGVALPKVAPRITVSPSGGDDTTAIQTAIDTVSARQPDHRGFRGAVLLAPGSFNISATLRIATSGVVLTGSGSGPQRRAADLDSGGQRNPYRSIHHGNPWQSNLDRCSVD